MTTRPAGELDKVTGDSNSISSIITGMLTGRILRSPYPHARIRSIDTSKAEKLRGVRAVGTHRRHHRRPLGAFFADQYILSVGKSRYVGEEVAAVAAIDIAEEALDLIEVDWEPLRPYSNAEEAMQDRAPLVHDDKPNNIAMHSRMWTQQHRSGLRRFRCHRRGHFHRRCSGTVHRDHRQRGGVLSPNGKYTIYMNTQTLFNARYRIATALGVPETDVQIVRSAVGGGFGGKSCDDNNALVCAVLARKAENRCG